MIFLSPLLLSISSNLDTLEISLSYGIKKTHITKFSVLLLAIITSLGTLISMYLGKLFLPLFQPELSNIFGATLLSFTGVYFIVRYMDMGIDNKYNDTSYYYFETSSRHDDIFKNSIVINSEDSTNINMRNFLKLSLAITLNNLCANFAASITGINISFSIFLNFIITIISFYLGYFNNNINISKWFSKYSNFVSGIILIILGIYEAFL